ncbi:unnamed protein product [Phaedon cochleariae]|uniref:ubiquitinyl hydrolase 1 n=1 Tax=Phaedon cochleariae TaxID=80249 RepID=A0A9N9WZ24_PHACE|nr:unnamed protein product [Phaedon cochleariae]
MVVDEPNPNPKPVLMEIDKSLSINVEAMDSWSRYLRMNNSKFVYNFVGQFKSTLRCTFCGNCSETFNPFWELSLPIPQRSGQLSLSRCLDSFTSVEILDDEEKPTCLMCKEKRNCLKSLFIHKFPKILVIHLKRFSQTVEFSEKLNTIVDFPLIGLDMSPYAAEDIVPCPYNLYAISNHSVPPTSDTTQPTADIYIRKFGTSTMIPWFLQFRRIVSSVGMLIFFFTNNGLTPKTNNMMVTLSRATAPAP